MTVPTARDPVSVESLVTSVVDEFLERVRRGEQPEVDDYVRQYPQLATLLRSLLPMLRLMQAPESDNHASRPALPINERLGDYQILRLIGRGGMGMVYEAEQLSLRRRVALKVLPFAAGLDSLQLQRFKNEAQAAAQLQHSRIVPVFAVGCEEGVHYFAMQYIEGQSLAGLLRHRREAADAESSEAAALPPADTNVAAAVPAAPEVAEVALGALETAKSIRSRAYQRAVVRLGVQAADALEHAHRQGVIHRDIKPANLLLDRQGNLWLTDFGLARFVHETGLTQSGDVVGTLPYMSPEQASAKRDLLDQRTDVYALGATLYELLTLRTPFAGTDRQQLLLQIAQHEPPWPRGLNPTIPADLETIVLKALEKNPAERYGTAQELGEELQRFLDDQPIRARRPSTGQRLVKWLRRHRPLVNAAAVVLFLAVGFLTISTLWVWREHSLRMQDALAAQFREQEQIRGNLDQSLKLLEEVFLKAAERRMLREPERQQADQEVLEKGLRFYQQFVEGNATNATVRYDTAKAHYRVGYIQQHLGRLEEAEKAYDEAVVQLERLIADHPRRSQYGRDLADAFHLRSAVRAHRGDGKGATADLRNEEKLLKRLVEQRAWSPDFHTALAACRRSLSLALYNSGQLETAATLLTEYLPSLQQRAAEWRDELSLQHELAAGYALRGLVLASVGQVGPAEEAYRTAINVSQHLIERAPRSTDTERWRANEYMMTMASWHHQSAALLRMQGRLDEARSSHEEALAVFRRLAADFPSMPDLQRDWAEASDQYGLTLTALGERQAAEAAFRQATETLQRLTQAFPARLEYRMSLASSWNDFGNLFAKTNRPGDAEQAYAKAADGYDALVRHLPQVPLYSHHLGGVYNNLARIYRQQGDFDKAQAFFATAVHYQRAALALNPNHAGYRDALCNHYQNVLQLFLAQHDHAGAARRAEDLARDLPDYWLAVIRAANAAEQCRVLVENDTELSVKERGALGKEYTGLARRWLARTALLAEHPVAKDELAWHLAHDAGPGFRDARQAVEFADAAVKMQPRRAKYWLTLGSAYCRLQDWSRAIRSLGVAWRLDREESGEVCFFLAIAHWHENAPDQARFWYRRGLNWMNRHQRSIEAIRGFQVEAAALLEKVRDNSAPG